MSVEFEAVIEPRTEDGGFGPSECSKCGAKTTCYLMISILGISSILMCMGCLDKGVKVICDAMIESYKKEKLWRQ
jgi:hypothetical protein